MIPVYCDHCQEFVAYTKDGRKLNLECGHEAEILEVENGGAYSVKPERL